MMKASRLLLSAGLALGALLLFSCATLEKGQVASVQEAALVSVYCDKQIDFSDFKGLGAAVNRLAQDKSFQLKPLATRLRDDMFNKYAPGLPFRLMPEKEVIGVPAYRAFETQKLTFNKLFFDLPDGYVFYPLSDDVAYKVLLDAFPNVQAFMVCTANFKLAKEFSIAGFGTARVNSYVTILALDRNRKVILRKYTWAASDETIKFALGGVFDATQIVPLCIQATDKAAKKFEAWFSKEMQE
jgi:hypothetical protein